MIWGNDSNVSSLQSLDGSEADSRQFSLQRDSSVDRYKICGKKLQFTFFIEIHKILKIFQEKTTLYF